MTDNKFTWVPFFKEVHEKIHNNYNAEQLANIANEIFGHIKDIDDQGNEVSIQEMTPINFIGYFNRRLTLNNRVLYCKKLREIMNLNSDIPTDFDGIPEFNNQNCLCMPFKKDRANYIIQEQWEISKQILENNIKTELFDKILSNAHPWIGLSYLSRFCFIVKPEKYYPYDKQMAINLNAKMPETFKGYEDYCKLLKYTYPEKTSYELSYEAFMENNNKQNKKQLTSQKKYWIYQPGEQGRLWNEVYANNIIAIGWEELGDLKQYNSEEDLAEKITEIYSKKSNPDKLANWEFANVMNIGDIVYVKKGLKDLIGRGIVQSDYYFDDTRKEYKSVRKIQWTHNGKYKVDFSELGTKQWPQKTLTDISEDKYNDFCLKIEDIFMNNNQNEQNNIIPLNQILYGPPGTGKTYNTVVKAMEIIGSNYVNMKDEKGNFKTYYSSDEYEKLKEEFDNYKNEGRIEFVTFHQSYSYEEFVEGIKPEIDWENDNENNEPNNKIRYTGKKGIFRKICEKANDKLYKTSSENITFKDIMHRLKDEIKDSPYIHTVKGKKFEVKEIQQKEQKVKYLYGTTKTQKNFALDKMEALLKQDNNYDNADAFYKDYAHESYSVRHYPYAFYNNLLRIKKDLLKEKEITSDNKQEININADKYILIIDEINRGNISKIFGELITLIEEDKRLGKVNAITITLPNSQEKDFGVPANLYIIGTMNTSDRSIASIDIALRRRFIFKEMMPNVNLVPDIEVFGIELRNIFTTLNERISILLDRDHQIGHSYFMKLENSSDYDSDFKRVWYDCVMPLLNEYFYGDWEKLCALLGDFQPEGKSFIKKINNVKFANSYSCDEDETYDFVSEANIDFEEAIKNAFKNI